MRIIEIAALPNGAHKNQKGNLSSVPEGWAVIPEGMAIPETFPFVGVTVENGVVTGMTAGTMPVTEPVTPMPTVEERLTGCESDIEQIITGLEALNT